MKQKRMADYAYHYSLKVRIYPSQRQKEVIKPRFPYYQTMSTL